MPKYNLSKDGGSIVRTVSETLVWTHRKQVNEKLKCREKKIKISLQ